MMRTTLARILGGVVLAAALAVPHAASADHGEGGTVAGSFLLTASTCQIDPQCFAWAQSCDPALASRTGVHSSIVNIGHIAGTMKTFRVEGIAALTTAKAAVYLADAKCDIINAGPGLVPGVPMGAAKGIAIPTKARWLVVMAYNAVNVTWSLTP